MGEAKRRGCYTHRKALAVLKAAELAAERQAAWDALPEEEKAAIQKRKDKIQDVADAFTTIIDGVEFYKYKINPW